MNTLNKFLNIPNEGDTDCFNLCISFWKEHGLDLPFQTRTISGNIPVMKRFLSNFDIVYDSRGSNTSQYPDLQYGDFLYVYMGYWGICLNESTLLTSVEKSGLFDLRNARYEKRLLSVFRPKIKIEPLCLLSGTEKIFTLPV
jgi:hypothetical protein